MCAKTTIGVLLFRRLTSFSSHSSCSVPSDAEAAGLQVDDVDEADEVHAALVEAVPAGALRALAESLQVALAVVFEHVVLAGHVEHRQRQLGQHLLQRVELRRLRQVREIAGVQHERRRFGCRLDLRDRRAQRRGDVGVRRLVEADVAVADLDEAQAAHAAPCAMRAVRGLLERRCPSSTPLDIVHIAPVPTQAMHFRKSRRSRSFSSSCRFIGTSLMDAEVGAPDEQPPR